VTGLDFSAESLRIARDLSARTGIAAEFVRADVLEAAAALKTTYDMVFTTRGVLMWIADLPGWARNCVQLLRPGGDFYLLDLHPLGMVLHPSPTGTELRLTSSYFGGRQPTITRSDASYAVSDVGLGHQETHEWVHPVGAVVTALAAAGLVIDFLHEHPGDDHSPTSLTAGSDSVDIPALPALYSIRAHRPG
jgi:SAM-dependent methyltransferase